MKSASCKAKGRTLQNLVCEKIRCLFNLSQSDVKPAIMGESGMDIKLSQLARSIIPHAIECKNVEKINIWDSWEQATVNGKKELLEPMLIIKKNGKKPLMVIDMEYGFELIRSTIE
jgi:hypothetical protein